MLLSWWIEEGEVRLGTECEAEEFRLFLGRLPKTREILLERPFLSVGSLDLFQTAALSLSA